MRSEILLAAEKYNQSEPVNIGTGQEISIKDVVELIAQLSATGAGLCGTSQPDGQPRRCLNVDRAKQLFGFSATTDDFREGLCRTIAWFLSVREAGSLHTGPIGSSGPST